MPRRSPGPGGNVVLIGFMGSGKTEVGRRLSELTGRPCVDTDALVESGGLSIPDIFASEGEAGFRRRERDAVERATRAKRAVIATGGGAVMQPENVRALKKSGVLVYLRAGSDELMARLENVSNRPMLDSPDEGRNTEDSRRRKRVKQLLAERVPVYESIADVVIDVGSQGIDALAREVLRRLDVATRRHATVRSVDVAVGEGYRVLVGRGLLGRAGALLPIPASAEKACIVSHPRVIRLWGDALEDGLKGTRLQLHRVTFPEGEERKSLETVSRVYRKLAASAFHRGDVVLALGGGVVGDVAGYAASTYVRGIAVVQVPTTLLGMVDSAIGGKTGVNLPEGKNLVGTFHQPAAVLADLDTLKTLAEREFRGGLAEVAKYALIADPSLGEDVVRDKDAILAREDALEPIVLRSAEVKAGVVASDERETGRRAILNYGHTVGHGLEALGMAGRVQGPRGPGLHHGEAVAVGMVFAAWLSVILGFAAKDLVDEHVRLLGALGLPTSVGRVSWEDVRRFVGVDKKYEGGLRFVLLEEPGKPFVQGDVPVRAIQEALAKVTEGS